MTIQTELELLIRDTCNDRMYPGAAPDGATKPYITYSRISVSPSSTLDGNITGNVINTRMQIEVWATSYADAQGVMQTIKNRLQMWNRQNVIKQEKDVYDAETHLHHIVLEVSIWHD